MRRFLLKGIKTFTVIFIGLLCLVLFNYNTYADNGAEIPGAVIGQQDTPGYDVHSNKAYGGAQSFWAYIDETTGDLCIDTRDKVHSSPILYRTGGFSMSRCKFNPAEPELCEGINSNYITYVAQSAALPSQHAFATEGGVKYEYSTFKYPFSDLVSLINGKGGGSRINNLGWSDEIQMAKEGKAGIWFRFDGFLYISHNEGRTFLPHEYRNTPDSPAPYNYANRRKNKNPVEIEKAEGWGPATIKSLDYHYNVYLYYGPQQMTTMPAISYKNLDHHITSGLMCTLPGNPENPDMTSVTYTGDHTTLPSGMTPYAAAGNANNQGYEAALGVPTTKSITGYAETIPWFGSIDVWVRMTSHLYRPTYTYKWTKWIGSVNGALPSAMSYWPSEVDAYIDKYGRDEKSAYYSSADKRNDGSGYDNVEVTFVVTRNIQDLEGTEPLGDVKVYAAFQYIDPRYTNVYDFESLKLHNAAYANDLMFPKTVPTEVKIARKKNLSDNTEFINTEKELVARTSNYIKWAPDGGANKTKGKLDTMYDVDHKEAQRYIYKNTKSVNDTVKIKWKDNTTGMQDNGPAVWNNAEGYYLGGSTVNGCNFRYSLIPGECGKVLGEIETNTGDTMGEGLSDQWYLCTESAGGNGQGVNGSGSKAHPYTHDNEVKMANSNKVWEILCPEETTIPAKIANGKYPTTIQDVRYGNKGAQLYDAQHKMIPKYARVFGDVSASTGHLYCNDISSAGGHSAIKSEQSSETLSYWNGAKNSSGPHTKYLPVSGVGADKFICDPINVHTPVISPTIITDGGGNYLEHSKNIGKTQLVTENGGYDGRSVDDTKDSAELRLDEFYIIHWQDLEEYSDYLNNSDEEHRQIATPPDQTMLDNGTAGGGYDDETKSQDQYTRNKYMKFPFEVYYDNRFYAANTWIELVNPNTEDGISFDAGGIGWGYEPGKGWDRHSDVKVDTKNGRISSKNHWKDTPIYIPTWAKEGLYNNISGRGGSKTSLSAFESNECMQFMVRAINTQGNAEGYKKLQDLANTTYNFGIVPSDGGQYVACWSMPAELSGWLYDFTIVGTSDADMFGPIDPGGLADHQINMNQDYSFTKNKQDKKTGILNRIGHAIIRFAKDGTIENPWNPQNTVTLTGSYTNSSRHVKGKSNVFEDMGNLAKGTTFTYLVRTISNLWDFKGDTAGATVHITPTFSWSRYGSGGWENRTHDELQIYYSDEKGNFIPFGTPEDRSNVQKVCLGNKQFEDSYYRSDDVADGTFHSGEVRRYGEWVEYTAYRYNYNKSLFLQPFSNYKNAIYNGTLASGRMSVSHWKGAKNPEFSLCDIILPQSMRLLSGEADQLKQNIYNNGSDVIDSSDKYTTYWTMAKDGTYFDRIYKGRFKDSGSSKGSYELGYIDTKDYFASEYSEGYKTMDYAFRESMQTWYGGYYIPSALYVVDLKELDAHPWNGTWNGTAVKNNPKGFITEYAYYQRSHGDGLQGDEEIFIPNGFLKIHFDIYAYKNGTPYLKYNGDNGGMWRIQGYDETDVPDPPRPDPDTPNAPPTDPGDVVVVDLGTKWSDRYKAGIFNIN